MRPPDLRRIYSDAGEATEGPWDFEPAHDGSGNPIDGGWVLGLDVGDRLSRGDAKHIANADPQTVQWLIDRIWGLEKSLEGIRCYLGRGGEREMRLMAKEALDD